MYEASGAAVNPNILLDGAPNSQYDTYTYLYAGVLPGTEQRAQAALQEYYMASGTTYRPTLGEYVLIQLFASDGNQLGICGCHFQVTGILGVGVTLDQIANVFDASTAATAVGMLPASATYRGMQVKSVDTPSALPGTGVVHAGGGTFSASVGPRSVSLTVTKLTAKIGRKHRGRMYVPFVPSAAFDAGNDGEPTAAYTTAVAAWVAATWQGGNVTVGLDQTTLSPIVYQKTTKTADLITAFRTNEKWASQHRRGDYGRTNTFPF